MAGLTFLFMIWLSRKVDSGRGHRTIDYGNKLNISGPPEERGDIISVNWSKWQS